MKTIQEYSVPVLTCLDAQELEKDLLRGDERAEWSAMQAAGTAIADAVLADLHEIGGLSGSARVLVLVGKGHNGGDALIAAQRILARAPSVSAEVGFVFGERALRPLAARAWREFQQAVRDRVRIRPRETLVERARNRVPPAYDLCLDGIFGFQFRPPVEDAVAQVIEAVNAWPIRLRAAVDLPSADLFQADFTYATGSVKQPVLGSDKAGRVRFLDLGFFAGRTDHGSGDRILTSAVLDPLRALRAPRSDKRSYGHVFIVGGSRGFPGALLMCASAAVRSGAGLVTVFAPESLASAFAARLPEAIWVPWPETPSGGLALEGEHLLRERAERADALVVGPGIGREPETLALARSVVTASAVPIVIDADALQREIVLAGTAPRVVTPHHGEFKRIAGDADLRGLAQDPKLTIVLKGPVTQVCNGGPVYHSLFGGPVLARGGSGDVLAGMIGSQLARLPSDPMLAAARAVVWHGLTADCLAQHRGQTAVATTELLDYLAVALRQL